MISAGKVPIPFAVNEEITLLYIFDFQFAYSLPVSFLCALKPNFARYDYDTCH